MWQCPHCGARQAETGRCWVCHRSSTCCATCARFRPSLVGGVGYCALDRSRSPLRGDELRGCWEAPNDALQASTLLGLPLATPGLRTAPGARGAGPRPPRAWITVESILPRDPSETDSPTRD
jgi:hypothetical protein